MAAPPDAEAPAAADHGGELEDRPPFLTWRGIYILVLAVLAVEVAIFTVLTKVLQ
jgi:hypothetical protein